MKLARASILSQEGLLHRFSGSLPVERLEPDRVEELMGFFKRAYADQPLATSYQDDQTIERRWRWLYASNPIPLDGGVPAWICRRKGWIIGHVGVLPAVAVVRGRAISIGWIRDLVVAPEARSLGVGALLVLQARSDVGCPLLVGGMNDRSTALFQQLGFWDGGIIPFYLKVYARDSLLETLPWSPLRRRLAAATIRVWQAVREWPPRFGRRAEPLEVTSLERFDDRFDRWWAGIEPLFPCVVRRTAETMRWRYEDHPTHRYHVVAARAGDAMRGVIVMRRGRSRGLPAGFITELLAHPADAATFDALLAEAERWLTGSPEERPAFLRCTVRHPMVERRLARAGFLQAPSTVRWMVSCEKGHSELTDLQHRDNWFLNAGDSDLDFF